MSLLDARLRLEQLNDIYGPMLTERQREVVLLHHYEDLSLGEIAERFGVSRPAVADHLKRGEECLEQCEARLGFLAKELVVKRALESALAELESLAVRAPQEKGLLGAIEALRAIID